MVPARDVSFNIAMETSDVPLSVSFLVFFFKNCKTIQKANAYSVPYATIKIATILSKYHSSGDLLALTLLPVLHP